MIPHKKLNIMAVLKHLAVTDYQKRQTLCRLELIPIVYNKINQSHARTLTDIVA